MPEFCKLSYHITIIRQKPRFVGHHPFFGPFWFEGLLLLKAFSLFNNFEFLNTTPIFLEILKLIKFKLVKNGNI